MKTLFGPCQTAPALSGSVRRTLDRFAVAVILAGASWLALPAEAEVVYTRDNVTISGDGVITLLKNGPVQFTIQAVYGRGACGLLGYPNASVSVTAATGDGVEGSGFAYAAELSNGDPIGPSQSFNEGLSSMAVEEPGGGPCQSVYYGYWCNGTQFTRGKPQKPCFTIDGYLGLEFELEGSKHYGWAHIVVAPVQNSVEFTVQLTGYAYETVSGMAINAGQTTDAEDSSALHPGPVNRDDSRLGAAVTKPVHAGSLGTLALGTQAPLLRRKESAGAVPENRQ
jgi:hypothetical protein